MLHTFVVSSFVTMTLTFSWYSLYGYRFFATEWSVPDLSTSKPPRIKHDVPDYMWEIYKNGIFRNSTVDVVKRVSPKFVGQMSKSLFFSNHKIEYAIPNPLIDEELLDAEVRITTGGMKSSNLTFQIYKKNKFWTYVDSKSIHLSTPDWVSLNVTSVIKETRKQIVLFMVVIIRQSHVSQFTNRMHAVLLLSYSSQSRRKVRILTDFLKVRSKRSTEMEDYEEETNMIWEDDDFSEQVSKKIKRLRNTCRRKPLYIDFSEIDYDSWIVAPRGYQAFQCVGKCFFPISDHLSPTKHSIIQTLVHSMSPNKAPRACCVPTRLESISVLYVDGGVLTYRFSYQDMVVAECGCR